MWKVLTWKKNKQPFENGLWALRETWAFYIDINIQSTCTVYLWIVLNVFNNSNQCCTECVLKKQNIRFLGVQLTAFEWQTVNKCWPLEHTVRVLISFEKLNWFNEVLLKDQRKIDTHSKTLRNKVARLIFYMVSFYLIFSLFAFCPNFR